jgi:DNA repair exonuclease SbcCD ATPase subunit
LEGELAEVKQWKDISIHQGLKIKSLEAQLAEKDKEIEKWIKRFTEISTPGSIGAFAARDAAIERAEKAEADNSKLRRLIKCEITEPPFDISDDMSAEFAVRIATIETELAEKEKLINNIKAWFHVHGETNCEIFNGAIVLFEKDGKCFNEVFVDLGREIRKQSLRAEKAEAELAHIDEILSRRPALADFDTRTSKIEHAITVARQADKLQAELSAAKREIQQWKDSKDGIIAEVEELASGKLTVEAELAEKDKEILNIAKKYYSLEHKHNELLHDNTTVKAELAAYKEIEDSLQKEIKRLDAELSALRENNNMLLTACKPLLEDCKEYLSEIGDCDHQAGICCCQLILNIENADLAIQKAVGK